MLTSYRFAENRIETWDGQGQPDWIDLADPTPDELEVVKKQYGLSDWFLTDPLDIKERPRLDQEKETLLIITRFSAEKNNKSKIQVFTTVPVGIILTPTLVVTVCRRLDLVKNHLELFKLRRHWTHILLAFALIYSAGTAYIEHLQRLEDMATEAEISLKESMQNEMLLLVLSIEKALINLTIALKSNQNLLEKFKQPDALGLTLSKDERDMLDDAHIENQQAIFMAEIFGQVLGSMSDTFGSIISNNLNKIMKFLTGVTIVLMLPTMIAGFYGMNVGLPISEWPHAFWAICAVSALVMAVVSAIFIKKNWM